MGQWWRMPLVHLCFFVFSSFCLSGLSLSLVCFSFTSVPSLLTLYCFWYLWSFHLWALCLQSLLLYNLVIQSLICISLQTCTCTPGVTTGLGTNRSPQKPQME